MDKMFLVTKNNEDILAVTYDNGRVIIPNTIEDVENTDDISVVNYVFKCPHCGENNFYSNDNCIAYEGYVPMICSNKDCNKSYMLYITDDANPLEINDEVYEQDIDIAEYIISMCGQNSTYGNWIISVEEIEDDFSPIKITQQRANGIATLLGNDERVLDITLSSERNMSKNHIGFMMTSDITGHVGYHNLNGDCVFDITLGTDYVYNYMGDEDDEYEYENTCQICGKDDLFRGDMTPSIKGLVCDKCYAKEMSLGNNIELYGDDDGKEISDGEKEVWRRDYLNFLTVEERRNEQKEK